MTQMQTTPPTTAELTDAPSVEEALAALTQAPGKPAHRVGRRRTRVAMSADAPQGDGTPDAPPPALAKAIAAAPKVGKPAAKAHAEKLVKPAPAKRQAAEPVVAAPAPEPAPAPAPAARPAAEAADPQAIAPYVAQLMVDARAASAKYQADAELSAKAQAAAIVAQAETEAQLIRSRAADEAAAIVATAQLQAQALAGRVTQMATELSATAQLLAAATPTAASAATDPAAS